MNRHDEIQAKARDIARRKNCTGHKVCGGCKYKRIPEGTKVCPLCGYRFPTP